MDSTGRETLISEVGFVPNSDGQICFYRISGQEAKLGLLSDQENHPEWTIIRKAKSDIITFSLDKPLDTGVKCLAFEISDELDEQSRMMLSSMLRSGHDPEHGGRAVAFKDHLLQKLVNSSL